MEQITQLRKMREEAILRLQANPDFKLVNSLDALISDLEEFSKGIEAVENRPDPIEENIAEDVLVETAETEQAQETSNDEVEDSVVQEIAELAESAPDNASATIEALEAELTAATSSEDFGTAAEEKTADASGMLN